MEAPPSDLRYEAAVPPGVDKWPSPSWELSSEVVLHPPETVTSCLGLSISSECPSALYGEDLAQACLIRQDNSWFAASWPVLRAETAPMDRLLFVTSPNGSWSVFAQPGGIREVSLPYEDNKNTF